MRSIHFYALCFLWFNAAAAHACPGGQYRDRLTGICLPKIGGDVGQAAERIKNETKAQTAGNALAVWIQQSRDTARPTSSPIPFHIRNQLAGFFSEDTLNRVRFKVGDNGLINLGGIIVRHGHAHAVTLYDTVVFADWDGANNARLWAHELHHVEQFMRMGVRDFSIRYARDYNSIEREAEGRELAWSNWSTRRIVNAASYPSTFPPRPHAPIPQPYGPATFPVMGATCVTAAGAIPMGPAPVGTPCWINTPFGRANGFIR